MPVETSEETRKAAESVPTLGTSLKRTEEMGFPSEFEVNPAFVRRVADEVRKTLGIGGEAREYCFSIEATSNAKGQIQYTIKSRGDDLLATLQDLQYADGFLRDQFRGKLAGE